MQTHVQHPWGFEPLQAHLVGLSRPCPWKPVRSEYEAGREDLSCSSRQAFSVHKDSVGSHPSPISLGSLEEKAFSKGVVLEKESNHLTLCIIACSVSISSLGSKCSQCADPGSSSLWGLLGLQPSGSQLPGADRGCQHTCLFRHCHLLAVLPPSSVLQMPSLPVLSLAEQSHPLSSGRTESQISLPVCSTEKHIIFLCRDRNVVLIYHPLPCLGLLLESVLFLFFKNMFAILTMFF